MEPVCEGYMTKDSSISTAIPRPLLIPNPDDLTVRTTEVIHETREASEVVVHTIFDGVAQPPPRAPDAGMTASVTDTTVNAGLALRVSAEREKHGSGVRSR